MKQKKSSNHHHGHSPSRRTQPLDRVVMFCDDLPSENGYSSSVHLDMVNGCETDRSSIYLGSVYSVRSELQLKEMYDGLFSYLVVQSVFVVMPGAGGRMSEWTPWGGMMEEETRRAAVKFLSRRRLRSGASRTSQQSHIIMMMWIGELLLKMSSLSPESSASSCWNLMECKYGITTAGLFLKVPSASSPSLISSQPLT